MLIYNNSLHNWISKLFPSLNNRTLLMLLKYFIQQETYKCTWMNKPTSLIENMVNVIIYILYMYSIYHSYNWQWKMMSRRLQRKNFHNFQIRQRFIELIDPFFIVRLYRTNTLTLAKINQVGAASQWFVEEERMWHLSLGQMQIWCQLQAEQELGKRRREPTAAATQKFQLQLQSVCWEKKKRRES